MIDRWRSAAAYEAFLHAHEDEYGHRDRDAASLYRSETVVGRFDVG